MPAAFPWRFLQRRSLHYRSFLKSLRTKDYQGRWYWEYLSRPAMGAFFYGKRPKTSLALLPNYFEGEMQAREVGIIVCLYAYSYFAGWHMKKAISRTGRKRMATVSEPVAGVTLMSWRNEKPESYLSCPLIN
ncbi:antirestriction protein [Klebsiella pneumoniae]|nr:antirestriction protein [Klebsiella pneumoniae]